MVFLIEEENCLYEYDTNNSNDVDMFFEGGTTLAENTKACYLKKRVKNSVTGYEMVARRVSSDFVIGAFRQAQESFSNE